MKKQKNIEVIITSHHIELHFKLLAILKQENWLLLILILILINIKSKKRRERERERRCAWLLRTEN